MKLKIEKYIEDGKFKQKILLTVFNRNFEAENLNEIIEKVKKELKCSEKGCNNCNNIIYMLYELIDCLENDFIIEGNINYIKVKEARYKDKIEHIKEIERIENL